MVEQFGDPESGDWVDAVYAAWNAGDVEALKALATEDIVVAPLLEEALAAGPWVGPSGVSRLLDSTQQRWSTLTFTPLEAWRQGDQWTVRVHVDARTAGDGIAIDGEAIHVLEFRDGQVARFEARRSV